MNFVLVTMLAREPKQIAERQLDENKTKQMLIYGDDNT